MHARLCKSFIVLCFVGLGGCGNVGELYLPAEKQEVQQTINSPSEN